MSNDLNLAITLPGQPVILAAPALVFIAVVAIMVLRKRRRRRAMIAAWDQASQDLTIDFVANGSELGPASRGRVNSHVVAIAPARKGRKKRVVTQYSVSYEAPEAPQFTLVKRIDTSTPIIDTGNPKFDSVVSVQTNQPELLSRFLTGPRRAAILRLLTYWPSAKITNREAVLLTLGIETQTDKLVDSVCHLVAAAETFDRPTRAATPAAVPTPDQFAQPATPPAALNAHPVDGSPVTGSETQQVNGEADLLTEIRLDEPTVLNDLFNTGLDVAGISTRFQQVYKGREVSWTGEVLRVGATERGTQRIAAFIGSADGTDPDSGRVVALTAIPAEPKVGEGDVVSFIGSLVNLDASQRLFHVA